MENELKSCIQCGNNDVRMDDVPNEFPWVECYDCNLLYSSSKGLNIKDLSIEWNKLPRHSDIKLLTEEKNSLLKVNHKLKLELEKEY